MKKAMILMLSLMMLSGSAMAQESQPNGQDSKVMRPKRVRMTQEQMTEKMVSELKLDKKQTKKVTKLNKKFRTLIEGEQQEIMKGQRPPMGQGRPDGNRGGGRRSVGRYQGVCHQYESVQGGCHRQLRKSLVHRTGVQIEQV